LKFCDLSKDKFLYLQRNVFDRGELRPHARIVKANGLKRDVTIMSKILLSVALIVSLMGCAAAMDWEHGVEMGPGEIAAEKQFESGFVSPWVGGDPPIFGSSYQTYPYYSTIHRGYLSIKHIGAPYRTYSRISLFPECFPFCDGYPSSDWRCRYCYPRNNYFERGFYR
jgi:hypothetical protein